MAFQICMEYPTTFATAIKVELGESLTRVTSSSIRHGSIMTGGNAHLTGGYGPMGRVAAGLYTFS